MVINLFGLSRLLYFLLFFPFSRFLFLFNPYSYTYLSFFIPLIPLTHQGPYQQVYWSLMYVVADSVDKIDQSVYFISSRSIIGIGNFPKWYRAYAAGISC